MVSEPTALASAAPLVEAAIASPGAADAKSTAGFCGSLRVTTSGVLPIELAPPEGIEVDSLMPGVMTEVGKVLADAPLVEASSGMAETSSTANEEVSCGTAMSSLDAASSVRGRFASGAPLRIEAAAGSAVISSFAGAEDSSCSATDFTADSAVAQLKRVNTGIWKQKPEGDDNAYGLT